MAYGEYRDLRLRDAVSNDVGAGAEIDRPFAVFGVEFGNRAADIREALRDFWARGIGAAGVDRPVLLNARRVSFIFWRIDILAGLQPRQPGVGFFGGYMFSVGLVPRPAFDCDAVEVFSGFLESRGLGHSCNSG